MTGQIKQPKTQVLLTNVAIVRLNSNSYLQTLSNTEKIDFEDEFDDESTNIKNRGHGKKKRKRNRRRNKKANNQSNINNESSELIINNKRHKNKKNIKFEIACYKNKCINWRNNIEKDISEVLQIERVFQNVKAGRYSNTDDLQRVFGTMDELKICKIILKKGELQVSKHERIDAYNTKFKEIANIIAEKCVNTETKKPIPVNIIENAMRDARCPQSIIHLHKSSKLQAINLIKILQTHPKTMMPIERAQMKLQINIPLNSGKKIKSEVEMYFVSIERESFTNRYQMIVFIDPGHYRTITDIVARFTRGKGSIEVLETAVQRMGDEML